VSQAGTGYPEPDVLYDARYNGVANTDIRLATTGNPWQGWSPVQGAGGAAFFNARSVAVAAINPTDTHNGELHAVAIGNDGNLYHDIGYPNGSWQGWQPIQGADGAAFFNAADVAMTSFPDGSVQVVAIGNDSDIWHNIRHPDGTWQGWNPVGGFGGAPTFSARGLAIAGFADGSAQLVAIGDDGNLYHGIRNADGTWQGWGQLPGFGGATTFNASAVAIAAINDPADPSNGQLQVAAIGNDGRAYHDIRFTDGNWQGWRGVLGPNGADHMSGTTVALTTNPGAPNTQIIANGDGQ
jgi:hypothetical protein